MVKRYNLAVIDRNLGGRAGRKQICCRSTLRVIFDDASLGEFQERVPNDTNIDAILSGAEPRSETLDDDVGVLSDDGPFVVGATPDYRQERPRVRRHPSP